MNRSLAALLVASTVAAFPSHPKVRVHHRRDGSTWMTATCKRGYKVADPHHLLHPDMTPEESLLTLYLLDCVPRDTPEPPTDDGPGQVQAE